MSLRLFFLVALGAPLLLASCETGGLPQGWRATPPGDGPTVTWDLDHEPLPDLPLPNDFATYPDPGTATGRRLNVSMVAPTAFEAHTRRGFDTMDGWGTYSPISIPFDAPIDTRGMMDRQGGGSEAFSEDRFQQHAVYLIDLETGQPMPVDVNSGNFPYVVDNPNAYFRNDPRAGESNLFLETVDEDLNDNGELDPFEDTDFDGVLDEPATFDGTRDGPLDTVDEMTWFYERETNTLVLRPILPLRPQRTYAVVVTDRLTGMDGESIRSPFPDVHHISQKEALTPLAGHLSDHPELYGDLSARGWEGVAFAFTFTTQSVYQEMDAIRSGLHGEGTLDWMADEFPLEYAPVIMRGGPGGRCLDGIDNIYITPKEPFVNALRPVVGMILGTNDEAKIERLLSSYDSLSHVAVIVFDSPFFLGDPRATGLEDYFEVDAPAGEANVGRETLTMTLFIPNETETAQQPFDLAFYVHGYGSASAEPLPFVGYMLQHGVAAATVNAEGHGVPLDAGLIGAVEALFSSECLKPAAQAILSGRAEDLNGDGTPDSGGDFWTSYVFHTRDSVRQSAVDHLRAIQILRSFDGRSAVPTVFDDSPIVFDRDGNRTIAYDGSAISGGADVAGDFDGNGVPDLGGASEIFFAGGSLGGIVTGIVGGTEPSLRVAAPIVGAGGLTDVAARTDLGAVLRAMHLRAMGPMITAQPASERGDNTACSSDQTSVYIMATDVTSRAEVEIACVDAGLLDADDVLYVYNATAEEARCGGAVGGVDGRFRVPFPADAGHRLFVEIYADAASTVDYGDCSFEGSPTPAQIIDTFEVDAEFQTIEWEAGDPLVSPTMGLGHDRQTPELRRTIALAQAGLDAGDPINYARRVFLEPLDQPINLLVANAVGDQWVPLSAGNAYARAAGLLPFLPPDAPDSLADWRAPASFETRYPGYASPNDLLIGYHVLEGVDRLERHPQDGLPPHFLVDVDDLAEGNYRFDPSGSRQSTADDAVGYPRLDDPLRWVRRSRPMPPGGDPSVWAPVPGEDISGLINHYAIPNGTHGFDQVVYDEDDPWDPVQYLINLVSRYGATNGQDLYYHSHPDTHTCLENSTCPFFEPVVLE